MTFQANIPLATDLISVSQNDLKNNFGSINTAFNVNHIDFNAANAGKHKFVEMPNQAGDPAGAVAEGVVYTKVATGTTELFFRRDNGTVIQMTTGSPASAANGGSTFLPGGFILKFGRRTKAQVGGNWNGGTITFDGGAFPNAFLSITLTPQRGTTTPHSMYVSNNTPPTTAGCTLVSDDNSWDFVSYVAIGN